MAVTMIAAAASNGAIGLNNRLLWRLPADMAYFVAQTRGKPVLMGRLTFESLGKPLKDRTNVILSRTLGEAPEGCVLVRSVEEALERFGDAELMVIGGEQVYRQMMPHADRILLTEIEREYEGDAFFPAIDRSVWKLVSREPGVRDEKNDLPYAFAVYEKQ
ncbi:dihydrofolate reductase [Cohnella sp. CFH 77786]|uniref:dihydrofolate reductase n=1 Tax=Cohnella sp. CFH 77786 TaxID=2662265 RepID=UPI001C60B722|nr:dihydrofolate reductase [Cohnella sp. CFH 77786]MBW5448144.1 dihydrofolate reductase [Cohnella sp. CFH 77786]